MIEHVFDSLDEAGLVATIEEATRAENAAAALRLTAIGALLRRRLPEGDADERALWACDGFDSAAAEVAAAMNISHAKACGQLRIAESLRDHLPTVAALFTRGQLSARVVSAITWRTRLVVDDAVWAHIDRELCRRAESWGPLADDKLSSALDAVVYQFDPDAVIAVTTRTRGRDITIGMRDDQAGTVSVFGRLMATDGALLEKKITAIAATVCADDPRTPGERRSDALAALADHNDHLSCRCTNPHCPVKGQPAQKSSAVISVIADPAALAAARADATRGGAAVMVDDLTAIPTPLLSDLLAKGATVTPLPTPCDDKPEPRYRPSATLAAFVHARDLTCRFPGCRVPASRCDIDHVVPYPIGATHATNLIALCRKHHLLKTFWVGDWSLTLAPDGSATWTSPTDKTYTTHPGSRALFPDWDTTTARLSAPNSPPPPGPMREQMMPIRRQTRAAQRRARIDAERRYEGNGPP